MYSHDTYRLGHIRRTMAIASQLRSSKVNILILTGSPIAGRFAFPDNIDFVRIPGMIKKTNEEYQPLSIRINPGQALDIRKNIIASTAKTFKPDLLIVDKEPLGLRKEILPTLIWIRRHLPKTQTVLGLRDIMDDAEVVRNDWTKKGVYRAMRELYSEIWVYGIQDFYDPISEYQIPASIRKKIVFTGYIHRKVFSARVIAETKREHQIGKGDKFVLVTTGGGGDGYPVMDNYLKMIEKKPLRADIKSVLVTGPFMPRKDRQHVFRRARRLGIKTYTFYRHIGKLQAAADLVITMGGYNTLCEILSQKTIALVIPRETPRREQLIRAESFHAHKLLDYIPWPEMAPDLLHKRVQKLIDDPGPLRQSVDRFRLTGIDIMRQRLQAFKDLLF